jgi:hypothetical protein
VSRDRWQSVRVRDAEQTVDGLVSALCQAGQALSQQQAVLLGIPGWSSLTTKLELKEWRNQGRRTLAFYGHVGGELAGVGLVEWIMEVTRDGDGWLVERTVDLMSSPGEYETVTELPARSCSDSTELAHALVPLIRELLALPTPEL